ncbi:MAG: hypothetical protein H6713_22385 [Myxococcales bacterium]|nr:hypothetical protein [Myxococcales bacterium]
MIDYNILCKTIEDWKAGRRPTALSSAPPPPTPAQAYDEGPASEDRTMVFDASEMMDVE